MALEALREHDPVQVIALSRQCGLLGVSRSSQYSLGRLVEPASSKYIHNLLIYK